MTPVNQTNKPDSDKVPKEGGTVTQAALDATARAYEVGVAHPMMPAPPIWEHCTDIPAGAVRFVIESRSLATDLVQLDLLGAIDVRAHEIQNDGGGSVHVFGTEDGLEHLRFDCFEDVPHYHYIDHAEEERDRHDRRGCHR